MHRDEIDTELLVRYAETHGTRAYPGAYEDISAPWAYYDANYLQPLGGLPRDSRVLELGCGPGTLLGWLAQQGFSSLTGVDISRADVEIARARVSATIECADVIEYLRDHRASFDVVIAKALLEHLPRERLLAFVEGVAAAMRPAGLALVDVPNMDWLTAPHERYMDLTHRVGFTRESLHDLLALRLGDVQVHGSRLAAPTRAQRLFRKPVVWGLRKLLYVVGEGADATLFASRSLVATGRAPTSPLADNR
jgi:2-polyprenyl-3-methyl-5-hydroxy-6-metoxy-1,4-benzoquinol methylase